MSRFRQLVKSKSGNYSTYISCPKQKAEGKPRTNHIYDCNTCDYVEKILVNGVLCGWKK